MIRFAIVTIISKMVDKRSKYTPSVKEKPMSMFSETSRIPQENFVTELLSHCKEYKVNLAPQFLVESDTMDVRLAYRLSQLHGINLITDPKKTSPEDEKETGPTFRLTYENPKKLDTLQKIECKGQEVSICILDALYLTMKKYRTLTTLILPDCKINAYGVMQIFCMLTDINCLRDINLDRNPNVQENYHLLCKPSGNLHYLSLQLCKITDEGVKKIMEELEYADPPNEPKLLALNLANNRITDRGAKEIARTLRTNRSLQSLVLTGNRICDDGATLIIRELNISQLTHAEIVDLRRRRYDALLLQDKMLNEMNLMEDNETNKTEEMQHLETPQTKNGSKGSRKRSKKSKKLSSSETLSKITEQGSSVQISRNSMADAIPDVEIAHPFGKESLAIGGVVRTNGNFILRHLNLSFNHLTGETLKELIACLRYQTYKMLSDTSRGLLYVKTEGNDFEQEDDASLVELEELLESRRSGEYLVELDESEDVQLENDAVLE